MKTHSIRMDGTLKIGNKERMVCDCEDCIELWDKPETRQRLQSMRVTTFEANTWNKKVDVQFRKDGD